MENRLVISGAVILLLIAGLSGCIEDQKEATNDDKKQDNAKIRFEITVENNGLIHYLFNNESYIFDIEKDESFGIPHTSICVSNSSICNMSNGSKLFKLVNVIDSSYVEVWFNESLLYNYTRSLNETESETWLDVFIYDYHYLKNPITISKNKTYIYPKIGNLGSCIFDSCTPPNPYVKISIKLFDNSTRNNEESDDDDQTEEEPENNDDESEDELENITVSTDKQTYNLGETVKIYIKNNLNITQILGNPEYSIQKYENDTWIHVMSKILYPCESSCVLGMVSPNISINPNQTLEYEWDQKVSWCVPSDSSPCQSKTETKDVTPGVYRIVCFREIESYMSYENFYSINFTII